jgi:hypothetical protein
MCIRSSADGRFSEIRKASFFMTVPFNGRRGLLNIIIFEIIGIVRWLLIKYIEGYRGGIICLKLTIC